MTITMKKKTKKFHLYDQYQLKHLSDLLCDDIENLLTALGLDSYKMLDKMVSMSCPIHGGDNSSAFNLYHQGDSYRGNWKCRTHGCENTFKSSIIGFIRGCLSRSKGWSQPGDEIVSFNEAIQFAVDFTQFSPESVKQSRKAKEKNNFINSIKHIRPESTENTNIVPRNKVINNLQIPSQYFLDRGYSSDILIKYDVGDCLGVGKEMSGRAVVPVYNNEFTGMIGCTGRSVCSKCDECNSYHSNDCPKDHELWLYSKWRHSKNFKTQECLYNYWFAKKYIEDSKTVILVESPGNVWRLEEANIHNSVALFGASLSHKQKMLLDISGAMNIITIMDNDPAGQEAAKQISEKCGRIYNIKHINIQCNDLGDMTVADILNTIVPQIQDHQLC
jgi:5S rRNA maturation endonuclease (ribonuclease M5)